jgi:ABC-type phosphate/phosphonate transport system substrate-binding protein
MYNAVPAAAAAWRELFGHVFRDTGIGVDIIDHGFPKPIAELWADPQLCCGFMCGWPFVKSQPAMQPIVAPVPSPTRYAHLPRYCSEFLVRDSSGFTSLPDTFGQRFGWMAADSQSGFNAPRFVLSQYVSRERPALFRQSIGPLGTPMRALESLRSEAVDVIALDSFFLDLCRRHEPHRLEGLRTIDTTPWTSIPMLVAAPGIDAAVVERLRDRLVVLHKSTQYQRLMEPALVQRFVVPEIEDYAVLEAMAKTAAERGYEAIR